MRRHHSPPHGSDSIPVWKRIAFLGIVTLALPALAVLALEIAARAVLHAKHGAGGHSYGLWQYDAELGAIHAPHAYNSNSVTNDYGFRNSEDVKEPKPPGALRIIAYGGSTTFCYNLPTEAAWPIRLEQKLRANRHPADQVLNAGAILWSIGHELARAKRDLPVLKPDIVIIYSGINEEANESFLSGEGRSLKDAVASGRYGLFARNLDQTRWLKRNSVLVRLMDYAEAAGRMSEVEWSERQGRPSPSELTSAPDAIVLQNFRRTLAEFIDVVRNNGGQPIYVVTGGIDWVGDNKRLLAYSREGAEIARGLTVPVVDSNDIVAAYRGNALDLFGGTGRHWSAFGADLLADALLPAVLATLRPSLAAPPIGDGGH